MLRKIVTLIVAGTFVWLQTSISYAENRHFNAFDNMKFNNSYSKLQSRGLTAQFGFSVPFGAKDKKPKPSYYGFKLSYGQRYSQSDPFQYANVRQINLLESKHNRAGMLNFKVAQFEFVDNQDRNYIFGNGNGNGFANGNGNIILILGAIAIGVGIYFLVDGDDNDTNTSSSS